MFTGIIEEIGTVQSVQTGNEGAKIKIRARIALEKTKVGDSVCVNGVCLTATEIGADFFTADVMAETLRRSNLGSLLAGSKVNLERAMAADGRFGGHIVSGHIDGTGTILKMEPEGNAVWIYVRANDAILGLVVQKGSIAIDGISLTVAKAGGSDFAVSVIPHTAAQTTLLLKKAGDIVNLENDIIGKYVQKLLGGANYGPAGAPAFASGENFRPTSNMGAAARLGLAGGSSGLASNSSNITEEFLRERGF